MTGATVPPAKPGQPDSSDSRDGLYDAIALIEASARDDLEAVMVLGRCADDVSVIAALAQMVGCAFSPESIADGSFRTL